jgi:hypothetical protein
VADEEITNVNNECESEDWTCEDTQWEWRKETGEAELRLMTLRRKLKCHV